MENREQQKLLHYGELRATEGFTLWRIESNRSFAFALCRIDFLTLSRVQVLCIHVFRPRSTAVVISGQQIILASSYTIPGQTSKGQITSTLCIFFQPD